ARAGSCKSARYALVGYQPLSHSYRRRGVAQGLLQAVSNDAGEFPAHADAGDDIAWDADIQARFIGRFTQEECHRDSKRANAQLQAVSEHIWKLSHLASLSAGDEISVLHGFGPDQAEQRIAEQVGV